MVEDAPGVGHRAVSRHLEQRVQGEGPGEEVAARGVEDRPGGVDSLERKLLPAFVIAADAEGEVRRLGELAVDGGVVRGVEAKDVGEEARDLLLLFRLGFGRRRRRGGSRSGGG